MTPALLQNLPSLWAMKAEALSAFVDALRPALRAAPSASSPESQMSFETFDGIATIPVCGPLTKNGLSFGGISFSTGMREISVALRLAASDTSVRAILLDVDSPGGTVDGIEELGETVAAVGAVKPVYAYADGLMASGGYWLACGAREIAAPSTAHIGSIGVILMQRDVSKALDDMGIKYNIITAGHYKAAGNSVEPLNDEMRAYIQSGIDAIYELFLQTVATGRGCSREQALAMADGKIFLADEARRMGLIDRVCSKESFINHIKEQLTMTLAELKAQHAEALQEYRAEVAAELTVELDAKRVEAEKVAGTAEREKVLALAESLLGAEAVTKVRELAACGVSPEQAVKLRALFAQSASPTQALDAMKATHVPATALVPMPAAAAETETGKSDFATLVTTHMNAHNTTRGEAIKVVAVAHPEAHQAWVDAQQKR